MVTDNYFVIGFDARYFAFLLDVYDSAKGVLFPLAVTFLHENSEKAD
jgi:hypothetical protein